ncbi:NAD(P)H-dependent oxidoreductase [Vitreoscilla massiliensis]|uniref:NAD(P)H-dependent oxidoreductase n=1 Tax=Vitreoscilla massiliensis TaxID=1689272 RepID=A0ABY4DZH0_9NEIS|nr:NADPH-dependent FMN reductase [Vitreoscilla massiliensis]UOO88506.1 NAD(P)H-dependent oxidoreductase [Vitreoscilla massiliensis]
MSTYKIGIVVGSLRKESINRQLAQAVAKLLPPDFSAEFIEIGDLPLYNQDLDGNQPAVVGAFKQHIEQQHGIIFVTPEYNRSIPGVLKNAIDHGSRPYGQNSWSGKAVGIMGTSSGAPATSMAQQHLRNTLVFCNMPALNQPEAYIQWRDGMIDAEDKFNERTGSFMQNWVDAYVAWVKKNAA